MKCGQGRLERQSASAAPVSVDEEEELGGASSAQSLAKKKNRQVRNEEKTMEISMVMAIAQACWGLLL